ncbi:phosphotransferase family protein [Nocardioides sp. CFH 31398]|uniref:phosphotransferase family protein n=1 Tax=Nocardioides sp. CFH 31398 TaxID=2919579 RepID=UPI001F054710|nr:aminoglycoside phosphotransferase family protein [Nocardioides sp. CFH 31398]MCH1867683.1 aminoglycoside phosphotransferase family protein [Nocardioides sp. CFH 31398]
MPEPDLAPAVAWAERHLGAVRDVRRLEGGWTSTMLQLTPADGPDAVLRLMTEEPWRTHGPGLVTREAAVQTMLAGGDLPAPRSLALDAEGGGCGNPAHLMTHLPGTVQPVGADPVALAALLARVHAVRPTIEVRTYQSWAWEEKYVVRDWCRDPGLWEAAFDLLRTPPPAYEPTFLHRDFQPRNVLWDGGRVTGLVDWVETSTGPAWLDVAHGATNLAVHAGPGAAEAFSASYVDVTGAEPQPYYDVMDVVGFLPPPGRAIFLPEPWQRERLEDRLRLVMGRLG